MSDNKLIAEFMGNTVDHESNNLPLVTEPSGHYYYLSECKYDKSWDWLMPVVEKIQSMKSEVHELPWDSHFKFSDKKCELYKFAFISETSLIDATYQVVTDFIKWYNSLNNKL